MSRYLIFLIPVLIFGTSSGTYFRSQLFSATYLRYQFLPVWFRYLILVPFFSSTMYDRRAEYGGRDEGRLESYLDSDLATEQINTNVSDWLKC